LLTDIDCDCADSVASIVIESTAMLKHLLTIAILFGTTTASASTPAPFIDSFDRPFNAYSWVTTHNSFNRIFWPVPNQTAPIRTQLYQGVRGLMLDTHSRNGSAYLCHGSCTGSESSLEDTFNDEIMPFMDLDPTAVVVVFLEDYASYEDLNRSLNRIPRLAAMSFDPSRWPNDRDQWPTLRDIIDSGQRLLIFTLNESNSGDFAVDEGNVHIMRSTDGTVENYWSLGDTIFTHDYSCKSRWDHIPLSTKQVSFPGKRWDRLFVMNHFHGVSFEPHSASDNSFAQLWDRSNTCHQEAHRTPNFIAIDHYASGQGLPFAGFLTQGGIILYDANDNDASSNIVCGIPGRVPIEINLKADYLMRCENDAARSIRLINLPAGTQVTVYDSPVGLDDDDRTFITATGDVKDSYLPTFEQNYWEQTLRSEHDHVNGLDGKVSHITISHASQ
jgi:hypothetical protein